MLNQQHQIVKRRQKSQHIYLRTKCYPQPNDVPMRHKRGTLDRFLFTFAGQENIANRANTSVITSGELSNIRQQLNSTTYNRSKVDIVPKNELERIRQECVIKDKTQLLAEKKSMDAYKTERMVVAMARKQRMQQQDRERSANAPLEVKSNKFGENTLLAKAQDQLDEDYDDVKHMNAMVLASKIYTVRDKQLQENRQLEENWVNEQRRLDMMMEIERLKAIKAEHEREERAAIARKRGAQVIIDQIASRQIQRQKEEEMLELEKAQLKANIEKVQQEEVEVLKAKRSRIQIMNDEVKIANQNALKQKQAARVTEKSLNDKIAEHQRQILVREEAKAREDKRIKEEKELEVQRLRELQEKAQDRAAAIDQLRAQQAYEKAEHQNRANEIAKKQKHEQELRKLHIARQAQFADNDNRLKAVKREDRQQFVNIVERQQKQEQEERNYMASRRNAYLTYKQQLNEQMKKNVEVRQADKHALQIEGKKNRLIIDQERNRIVMIKAQKLRTVMDEGIEARYTAELLKKKASF